MADGRDGRDGRQGPPGPPGIDGPPGPVGPQGPQGERGPAGERGADGRDGRDGLSAYQIAVERGFVGTEIEWLASLHGHDGQPGPKGDTGARGPAGPAGAAAVPAPAVSWRGTFYRDQDTLLTTRLAMVGGSSRWDAVPVRDAATGLIAYVDFLPINA